MHFTLVNLHPRRCRCTAPAAPRPSTRTCCGTPFSCLFFWPFSCRLDVLKVLISCISPLLTSTPAAAAAVHLPLRYQSKDWVLAYGSHRDGICLHTLQRKCAHLAPTLLVVKEHGHVFGAYAPEAWHKSPRFYGTGARGSAAI